MLKNRQVSGSNNHNFCLFVILDKFASTNIEEILPGYARQNFFICFPSSEFFEFGGEFNWILDLVKPSDNCIPTAEHATAQRIFKILRNVKPSGDLSDFLLKTPEHEIADFVSYLFELY